MLICLCTHYADSCCINLVNWNIFQQYNWNNFPWFFLLSTMKMKTRPWRYVYYYIKISRLKNFNIFLELEKIKPQHCYPKAFFSEDKKPQQQDLKTEKQRHWDSNAKKPRYQVSAKFWSLSPLWLLYLPEFLSLCPDKSFDICWLPKEIYNAGWCCKFF